MREKISAYKEFVERQGNGDHYEDNDVDRSIILK
jgi:hypothetical protein